MNIDVKTADGEDVEFGGAYYDGRGTEHRVVGIRLIDYRHITNVSLSCLIGKVDNLCCVSMRPNELYSTPPDSWEKLEEDLGKIANNQTEVVCPYFDREIKDCEGCKLEGYDCSCSHAFLKDVMARIRKLRGEA